MSAALEALAAGQVAIIATDTVYGLAALPASSGYERIFQLKGRPQSQVLPWLVSGSQALKTYARDLPPYVAALAGAFWPGALTLVVRASEAACALGGVAVDGSVALRCPASEGCRSLLDALGLSLACTSANVHGQPAASNLEALDPSFACLPGYAELPASCPGGLASTIVDCRARMPRLLREGPIAFSDVLTRSGW